MKKRSRTIFFVVLTIIFFGILFLYLLNTNDKDYETYKLKYGKIKNEISLIGKVESDNSILYSAKFNCVVEECLKNEGDTVKTGDLIISLNKNKLKNEYDRKVLTKQQELNTNNNLIVSYQAEKQEYDNAINSIGFLENKLVEIDNEINNLSKGSIDDLQDDIQILKEKKLKIEEEYLKCKEIKKDFETSSHSDYNNAIISNNIIAKEIEEIKADYNQMCNGIIAQNDGVIVNMDNYAKDFQIAEGSEILTIASNKNCYATFEVSRNNINLFNLNQSVRIIINDKTINANVSNISQVLHANDKGNSIGNIKVDFEIDDGIIIGEEARLLMDIKNNKKRLIIPTSYMSVDDGKCMVKILENGIVKNKEVQIGASDEKNTEVIKGLKLGDKIIQQ